MAMIANLIAITWKTKKSKNLMNILIIKKEQSYY